MGGRASRTGDEYAGRTVTGTGSTCYRSRVNHTPDRTPTTGADVDGRSARWEGHRQARRAELVTAAITAIEERGAGAGMDEIASVAGTSKTVFYRHFHDRAGLYRAVAERVDRIVLGKLRRTLSGSDADAAEAPARVPEDPRGVIGAAIDSYLSLVQEQPEVYRFIVAAPLLRAGSSAEDDPAGEATSRMAGAVSEMLAVSMRAAGIDEAPARVWGEALVGMVRAAADTWLAGGTDAMPRAQLVEHLTTLAWSGVGDVLSPAR